MQLSTWFSGFQSPNNGEFPCEKANPWPDPLWYMNTFCHRDCSNLRLWKCEWKWKCLAVRLQ